MEHDLTTGSGRPRDAEASPALLEAARRLVLEKGYAATSISDIAAAAGTGRQTLYRRWPGKAQLILDAAVAALFGALWYRLLLGEPLDDGYAAALAGLIRAEP